MNWKKGPRQWKDLMARSHRLQSGDRWSVRSEGLEWYSIHAERLGLENMEAVTSVVAATPTCLSNSDSDCCTFSIIGRRENKLLKN
ncbi:hypothetical protein AMELA_G00262310 [Ameiurus melas]|uniref:Uncharacterized protein n=1 Tax=Ameiurus melas TaxID=219545 RepID=A0A7J5ZR45_AMEME|nr:hypothetical protein AMELA_G00262310 [Ameiurus melas]